jgi:hypothetical protein
MHASHGCSCIGLDLALTTEKGKKSWSARPGGVVGGSDEGPVERRDADFIGPLKRKV